MVANLREDHPRASLGDPFAYTPERIALINTKEPPWRLLLREAIRALASAL